MEVDEPSTSGVNEWEHLSMDTMQWNELVHQLEDLALLDAVLQQKSRVSLNCMPHCLKWKPATVSLSLVLNKGKGKLVYLLIISDFILELQSTYMPLYLWILNPKTSNDYLTNGKFQG